MEKLNRIMIPCILQNCAKNYVPSFRIRDTGGRCCCTSTGLPVSALGQGRSPAVAQ